jgi:hypothetical protein
MKDDFKQILYITYFFPPLGGSASQGRLKYAKYLPNFGINPIIITVKPVHYFATDTPLVKELPSSVRIYRSESFDPNRLLYLFRKLKSFFRKSSNKTKPTKPPVIFNESLKRFVRSFFPIDEKVGWIPLCFIKSVQIIKKFQIHAIMVSLAPFHSAVTSWLLSKVTSLPFILIYDDLWNLNPYPQYTNTLFKLLNEWLERRILKDVSYVVLTTPHAKEKMLTKFPFLKFNKTDVLYYGWDKEDFLNIEDRKFGKHKIIRVGYAGTFCGYRTPKYFLNAFAHLFNERKINLEDFELHFVGNYSKEIRELFEEPPVKQIIHLHPYMPHRECLSFLKQMDYLAIFLGGGDKSNAVIPGKLFDYFALKVPIIGFTHRGGDLWNMLVKYGFLVAEFDDVNDNMRLILNLMKHQKVSCLSDGELEIYEKKFICSRLAKRIKWIIEKKKK